MDIAITLVILGMLLVCLVPIINFLRGRLEFIEIPLLFSFTVLGWFLPQYIADTNYEKLPAEAVLKAGIMALLCFSGLNIGYFFFHPKIKQVPVKGNVEKLKSWLFFFTLIFLIPFFMLRQIPSEDLQGTWSGTPVALFFFYSALKYTGIFSFLLWLGGDRSKRVFFALFVGACFYLITTIGGGRRAESLELFFVVTGGLFFIKKIRVPKFAVILSAVLFVFFMANISQYRSVMVSNSQDKLAQLFQIDWIENLKDCFTNPEAEVTNYIMGLYAIDNSGSFNYGLTYWNSFVFHYIPRQIVGEDFKNRFMASVTNPVAESEEYGHEALPGETYTGMLDAFSAFYYFGCVNFILIGMAFKYLYLKARTNLLKSVMFYLFLLTSGLHSVTHTTDWCLFAFIHLYIFTFPYQKFAMITWPPKSPVLPQSLKGQT